MTLPKITCLICSKKMTCSNMLNNQTSTLSTTSTTWSGWQIVSTRCYGCKHGVIMYGTLVCTCASRTMPRGIYGDRCESYWEKTRKE